MSENWPVHGRPIKAHLIFSPYWTAHKSSFHLVMDVNTLSAIICKEDVASYFQKQLAQLRVSSILCCHVMLTLISFLTAETTARIAPDAIADTSAMHDTSKGNQWPVLDLRAHARCAMHTGTPARKT